MHDDRTGVDRRTALSVLVALAALFGTSRQAHAGIPTVGEKGQAPNITTPGDVIDALQQVINGVSTTSPTQDVTPPETPHFCGWGDVESTLRSVADGIHGKAEKTDDWRWNKHHSSC